VSQSGPSKIIRKALAWLISFYALSLLVAGAGLRTYLHREFSGGESFPLVLLAQVDSILVFLFWLLLLLSILFCVLFTFHFFHPLKILIGKVHDMEKGVFRRKNFAPISGDQGEWFELDLGLTRMNRELARRRSEIDLERGELGALLSATSDPTLAIDEKNNIRYCNLALVELTELPEEDLIEKPLRQVFQNHELDQALNRARKTKTLVKVQLKSRLSSIHPLRHYSLSLSPMGDHKKLKGHVVVVFHDITEQKRVEKVRMDFVANASHELKTPMTSAKGYLSMIKSHKEDESSERDPVLARSIQGLEKNLVRLQNLVSDLLQLSKVEGRDELPSAFIDPEYLTESLVEELASQWRSKRQRIECRYDIESVWGNEELIEKIILNLVGNAIKYSHDSCLIKIHWFSKGNHALLSVKDNGPGIESYHLNRIFERFYRVRDGRENLEIEGTGLGLSIVRHCVLAHGGGVDVKSAPGLGTEFLCTFPKK